MCDRAVCLPLHALFCIAIDWIMSRCAGTMGITVGKTTFTGQDYADNAVLITDDPNNSTAGTNSDALRRRCSDDGPAYNVYVVDQDSAPMLAMKRHHML